MTLLGVRASLFLLIFDENGIIQATVYVVSFTDYHGSCGGRRHLFSGKVPFGPSLAGREALARIMATIMVITSRETNLR